MLFGFASNKSHKLALSKYWFTVASVNLNSVHYWTVLEKDIASFLVIHYFHINHNAPCLPTKFLHKYCFQVLSKKLRHGCFFNFPQKVKGWSIF